MKSMLILQSTIVLFGLTLGCSDQNFAAGSPKKGLENKNKNGDANPLDPNSNRDPNNQLESGGSTTFEVKKCSADYQIPGNASPYFAGSPATASVVYSFRRGNNTDTGANSAPVQVIPTNENCLKPGAKLTFTTSGSLSHGGGTAASNTPEGNGQISPHALGAAQGKSDLLAPMVSIVAVFVGNDDPASSAPPSRLDFTTAEQRNYTILEPKLNQIFFVGDGKTDGGAVQRVTVPEGAGRLYLATWDLGQWNNNGGSMVGAINLVQ